MSLDHPALTEAPRRPSFLALAGAVALAAALSGCYTMLRHPNSTDVTDGGHYDSECLQCHDGATGYADDPWVADYWFDSYVPWISYYDNPWWSETRWACCGDDDDELDRTVKGGRVNWGRVPRDSDSALPAVIPRISTPAPSVSPPRLPAISTPSTSAPPAQKTQEEPKEEQKPETPPRTRPVRR